LTLQSLVSENVRYQAFDDFGSMEAAQFIETLRPCLGIAVDVPTLPPALGGAPRLGTIGLHKSLPDLQGLPSGPGESGAGRPEIGAEVRWVAGGEEPGQVLLRYASPAHPYSTAAGLAAEVDLLGTSALIDALRLLDSGGATAPPQLGPPTRPDRRPDPVAGPSPGGPKRRPGGRLRSLAKDVIFLILLHTIIPLRNLIRGRAGKCHATILLFHRVADSFDDSITVGVEQFRDFLRLLRRRYDVVDMAEFLEAREVPRRKPVVVLTFDDGYEDNLLAALLLRREGLPCTFFVATRVVGGGAFPHDLKKLGYAVPALSWDQARVMAGWGFHIGNHTAHHVNLGAVSLEEACGDVSLAMDDLGREIGAECRGHGWLAYPYGKAGDINAEVRGRLHGLGITHCFSAYGGTNPVGFSVLDIRRQNIDRHFSPVQFLMAIEGWTPRSASSSGRKGPGPGEPAAAADRRFVIADVSF
jgi:peptidoglycan/xylan/chitin deacetylase (PgdA/CDA1 family)